MNIILKNRLLSRLKVLRYVTESSENPFNRLRNIAIRHTTTSHYWVMDMDMWPSQDAYKTLMSLDDQYLRDDYLAVIVPCFAYKRTNSSCRGFERCVNQWVSFVLCMHRVIPVVPKTIPGLRECLATKKGSEIPKRIFNHVDPVLLL